ncbi:MULTISPECIES: hypothetical protein [Bacillus]|uniref:hypothetical protein n=1 Tax=Bacillus TaxID=1386 RepID=UPI0003F5ED17|nr:MULTISPECIES: hypothetical protein [Bacillus]QHZ45456.1 hypothetical protein M654_003605 [Bacillus sp. NSP9.1]WFA04744.1 hypothetical protein P3X63_19505 [Bacillus sp. HSf4]
MKQKSEESASLTPKLLELIQEQKRMNQEIINRLEAINSAPPLSSEIRYLKVLLSSSSTHIINSLIELTKQVDRHDQE